MALMLQHNNSTSPSVTTNEVYKDINALKVQANILEEMQQRIIVNSPELYKKYDQMFGEVEAVVIENLINGKVDRLEKEKKLKKGELRLDLDRLGEYPI